MVDGARRLLGEQGRGTILFLDEVHRFNRAQQDALLPSVEEGLLVLIGATTENPFFEVNAPLLSRSTLWRLEPLSAVELEEVVARGLDAESATAEPEAVAALVGLADGDARAALTTLEVAMALAGGGRVTLDDVERADEPGSTTTARTTTRTRSAPSSSRCGARTPTPVCTGWPGCWRPGRTPGSSPAAWSSWPARTSGRPTLALVVADAAARAVEFVGLPEAQLNLAQAVVHLATAPKSNRVTVALGRAQADVRQGPRGTVPAHLREPTTGVRKIGHSEGYRLPPRPARGVDRAAVPPDELQDHRYYEPSDHGHEAVVGERLTRWRSSVGPDAEAESDAGDDHRRSTGLGETVDHDAAGTSLAAAGPALSCLMAGMVTVAGTPGVAAGVGPLGPAPRCGWPEPPPSCRPGRRWRDRPSPRPPARSTWPSAPGIRRRSTPSSGGGVDARIPPLPQVSGGGAVRLDLRTGPGHR